MSDIDRKAIEAVIVAALISQKHFTVAEAEAFLLALINEAKADELSKVFAGNRNVFWSDNESKPSKHVWERIAELKGDK